MESQITITTIIIIVWLIFPGIVFKRFYYKGQFAKQFGADLFADRLISSIFWGIIVQIITFLIYSRSFGFTFTGIRNKTSAVYASVLANQMPTISYSDLEYILGYLAFLIIIAFCLGSFIHFTVRYFKIDLKYPVFRFANHWNYYFRGEIVSMREFKSLNKGRWLSTTVDVVIDDGSEKNKMISGFLTQHTISHKTGDLESIYLTSATRYSHTDKKFIPIPGDCLVIPFDKVIDLNLRYTFQVINDDQKKQILFRKLLAFCLIAGLLFATIFPWYLKINIFLKIGGVIFGCLTWLLFIIVSLNPLDPRPTARFPTKDLFVLFFAMVFSLSVTLLLLNITPF